MNPTDIKPGPINVDPNQVGIGTGSSSLGTFKPPIAAGSPTPIIASTLGTGAKPLSIPPVIPTVQATPNVTTPSGTVMDAKTGIATIAPPAPVDTQTQIKNALAAAGAQEAAIKPEVVDPTLRQNATNDYNSYIQAKTDLTNKVNNLKDTMVSGSAFADAEISKVQREGDANVSNLAIQAQISQGLYDNAQKTVDEKVAAQLKPIQDNIDFLTKFSAVNNNDLTDSQKTLIQNQATAQQKNLETVQKAAGDIQSTLLKNGNYAAVAPTIDKIMSNYNSGKITANEASSQMYAAASNYGAGTVDQTAPENTPPPAGQQGITQAAGISLPVFNYLTQGTASMSRMPAAQRNQIMKEASNFLNKNGIDVSTFQTQYKAYNDVLQKNIERANNTSIFAGEVAGTADALLNVINPTDLKDLSNTGFFGIGNHTLTAQNVADLALGNSVNNPIATKYSFQIGALANDLAGYLAASRGATSPENADLISAGKIIANGMNSGSIDAFKQSLITNEQKVAGVVNKSVDSTRKQVWNLFGAADKYKSAIKDEAPVATQTTTKSGKSFDTAGALKAGYTQAQIDDYIKNN